MPNGRRLAIQRLPAWTVKRLCSGRSGNLRFLPCVKRIRRLQNDQQGTDVNYFRNDFLWDFRSLITLITYVGDLFTCVFVLGFLLLVFLERT